MPDHVCPNCGQKALGVATRCPRCGLPIEAHFIQHQAATPKRSRLTLILLSCAAVVAILVANAIESRDGGVPLIRLPAKVIDSAPAGAAVPSTDSNPIAVDSAPPAAVTPAPAESVARVVDSAPAPAPAPVPTPPAEPVIPRGALRRYADTWINVRSARGNNAPVIRILRPGDPVLVDSLVRGWYRVVASGEAVGYLDRRFLDSLPPSP